MGTTKMYLEKVKTVAYGKHGQAFDLNSLGRDMAIDLSQDEEDKDIKKLSSNEVIQ